MTATSKMTRSIRTKKQATGKPESKAAIMSMHERLLRFQKVSTPALMDDDTSQEYMARLREALDKEGLVFRVEEGEVQALANGYFQCTYEASYLVKETADEYALGAFTVIGNPMTARQTALDMAMVDFAGAYQQLAELYQRSLVPKPLEPLGHAPVKLSETPPELQDEAAPEPSPELRAALEQAVDTPEESKLIEQKTPDGLPILVDLFNEEGDAGAIASEAAQVLRDAVTTAPNNPTMKALWDKNADGIEFIKDYAPGEFNALIKLFKARSAALHNVENNVVEHPGKTRDEAPKGRRRQRRA